MDDLRGDMAAAANADDAVTGALPGVVSGQVDSGPTRDNLGLQQCGLNPAGVDHRVGHRHGLYRLRQVTRLPSL